MSAPESSHACAMLLMVQAEFDGELDAAQAAELVAHRALCPVCRRATDALAAARELTHGLYEPLRGAVRGRLLARLEAAKPQPPRRLTRSLRAWLQPSLGFALGAACAAALSFLLLSPEQQELTRQIVAGHVRALQPGHLEDVASTSQHTVKPWFAGRLDFSPPVKDLASAGFPLQGGRLDYIGGRAVAALVYRRHRHVIDLFIWPQRKGAAAPATAERHGYNVVHWTAKGMAFWAVSDVELRELRAFVEAWQHAP